MLNFRGERLKIWVDMHLRYNECTEVWVAKSSRQIQDNVLAVDRAWLTDSSEYYNGHEWAYHELLLEW